MKKLFFAFLAVSALLTISQNAFAQQSRGEEIMKSVTDYFNLDRENIHAQLDKKVFMTNEKVWFKGYVFLRKRNMPFFNTINIYGSLIDAEGKTIETKLMYGNQGTFTGYFNLGNKLKSGKYYLQFYTNWMNNFLEDESAVYEIAVVNPQTGSGTALAKADPSKIIIDFMPEGGTLVKGIQNNIGIHVADCNNNPTGVSVVNITDASGKVIKQVQLNKLGFGKFDLPANFPAGYKAIVAVDDIKHEKPLPAPELKGIALEVNNYAFADKTAIKVKTNKVTYESFNGQTLYMLVHQDDKSVVMELSLNNANFEQTLVLPNTDFAPGLNTIRILDSNLIQLSERMFFNYPKTGLNIDITKKQETSENLRYAAKINQPNMSLSLTVLPEGSASFDDTNDIYGSFLLLPYLENQHKASGRHYFTTLTKNKLYELDLYLLSQKSKYKWLDIREHTPKSTYNFDMGVTLKGTIPGNVDTRFAKIRLHSLTSGIDEVTTVNDKKEFTFNNLVITDSSYVNFTLLKKGAEPKELTLAPQVLNGNTKFNKPYRPVPHYYAPQANTDDLPNPNIYSDAASTEIEEVKIEGKKLRFANIFGNGNLQGYKISEMNESMYHSVIQFIRTYGGFRIEESSQTGQLAIYSRTISSINGQYSGPIIYVDNAQLLDVTLLTIIQMSDVDEIYMSSTAIIPSLRNYQGIIKIYLKKGARPGKGSRTPTIVVKNGFEKPIRFENVTYNSVDDEGFKNFGIIDWQPALWANENGEFPVIIPKVSSKPFKVLIEGFSGDGKLISEIKTIDPKS